MEVPGLDAAGRRPQREQLAELAVLRLDLREHIICEHTNCDALSPDGQRTFDGP